MHQKNGFVNRTGRCVQGQELLIYVEGATKHDDLPHATSQARPPAQGRGWDALLSVASRAAVVVTEDMPVPPDAQWLQVRFL